MKRFGALVASLASLLAFAACGKGLSGTYAKCIPLNASSARLTSYDFDGDAFTYRTVSYPTSDCSGIGTAQDESAGTRSGADTDAADADGIDLVFGSGGLSGTTLYQIYKLEGDRLYLGDASGTRDGLSAAKRPGALEATPYIKQ